LAENLLQARPFFERSGLIIIRRKAFCWHRCRGGVNKSDWRTNNYNAFDCGVEERPFGELGAIQRESSFNYSTLKLHDVFSGFDEGSVCVISGQHAHNVRFGSNKVPHAVCELRWNWPSA